MVVAPERYLPSNERPSLGELRDAAERERLRGLRQEQRRYVLSVVEVHPQADQPHVAQTLERTGYIGGGASAGARADDSYNW